MTAASVRMQHKRRLRERVIDEFRRFIVIFLYLWIVFGLLSLHKNLILVQKHLDYPEHAFAIINALVFAKVLLIAEDLHLGRRFENKPLIRPIIYKSFIFAFVLIAFHIIETALVGVWHGNTVADSLAPVFGSGVKGIFSVGVMCFIILLPFFGFRELARVIGPKQMKALMLESEEKDTALRH